MGSPQSEWNKRHPEVARAASARWRERNLEKAREAVRVQRAGGQYRRLRYGMSKGDFEAMLVRQRGVCFGCLTPIDATTANVDHDHTTGTIRGLLCRACNLALGGVRDSQAVLRRLMAYLERNGSSVPLIYVAGSMKNRRVPEVGNLLRTNGYDAMDEWHTPGPEADDNWQAYETARGRSYQEAVQGRGATNIFLFDRSYLDISDALVVVAPMGRSSSLELGHAAGSGIPTILFLDGQEPDRFEVMPREADFIANTEADLLGILKEALA